MLVPVATLYPHVFLDRDVGVSLHVTALHAPDPSIGIGVGSWGLSTSRLTGLNHSAGRTA